MMKTLSPEPNRAPPPQTWFIFMATRSLQGDYLGPGLLIGFRLFYYHQKKAHKPQSGFIRNRYLIWDNIYPVIPLRYSKIDFKRLSQDTK